MQTDRNILIAFLLNLAFAAFELVGGLVTGSVAILSDAIHDLGDAVTIALSYTLEKRSRRPSDDTHPYGYARYSVLGGAITALILVGGSVMAIGNALYRILHPIELRCNGMLLFAIVGVAVNCAATYFTREGDSVNQKAVNLHMLEDALGWLVILIGAISIRLTHWVMLDPLMSVGVATFILWQAVKQLRGILTIFMEETPAHLSVDEVQCAIAALDEVVCVSHIRIWSLDGTVCCATLHIVTDGNSTAVKATIRQALIPYGIRHVTIETDKKQPTA